MWRVVKLAELFYQTHSIHGAKVNHRTSPVLLFVTSRFHAAARSTHTSKRALIQTKLYPLIVKHSKTCTNHGSSSSDDEEDEADNVPLSMLAKQSSQTPKISAAKKPLKQQSAVPPETRPNYMGTIKKPKSQSKTSCSAATVCEVIVPSETNKFLPTKSDNPTAPTRISVVSTHDKKTSEDDGKVQRNDTYIPSDPTRVILLPGQKS
jgi:hypothetical protein